MRLSTFILASALGALTASSSYVSRTAVAASAEERLAVHNVRLLVGTASRVPGWSSQLLQPSEFASKGDGRVQIEARLVEALDRARRDAGHAIRIISGYRGVRHKRAVGGARNSQHLHGMAVDIDLGGLSSYARYRLMWFLIRHGFTSFCSHSRKPNLLHADMRRDAVTWHHGRGAHPAWFLRALKDTH